MTLRSFSLEVGALGLVFYLLGAVASIIRFYLREKISSYVEAFALSVVALSMGLGLMSLLGLLLPPVSRSLFAAGMFGLLVLLSLSFFIWSFIKRRLIGISKRELLVLGAFLSLVVCSLGITYSSVRADHPMPDGAFVDKEDVLAVGVQKIVGNWPADNAIPFVVQEYFAKGISFKENHPILPGQEVVNRPILLSLITLPFRWAMTSIQEVQNPLPSFEYANANWPDYRVFLRDQESFGLFLAIGILFNATIILGAALFLLKFFKPGYWGLVLFGLLFVTSPYFTFHTFFTWPKNLAAFFVLSAIYFHFRNFKTSLVAACFALAYLSHPYAAIYMAVFLAYLCWQMGISKQSFKKIVLFLGSFLAVVLPWLLWTKIFLRFENDLFAQNFFNSSQNLKDFVWVRVYNIGEVVAPLHWHLFPFEIRNIISLSIVNVFGAVGSLLCGYAILNSRRITLSLEEKKCLGIVLASCLTLWVLFSVPSMVIAHGLQPAMALLIVFLVGKLESKRDKFLMLGQVVLNIFFAILYIRSL